MQSLSSISLLTVVDESMQLYLIHHRVSSEISSHRELDSLTDELID